MWTARDGTVLVVSYAFQFSGILVNPIGGKRVVEINNWRRRVIDLFGCLVALSRCPFDPGKVVVDATSFDGPVAFCKTTVL